MPIMGHSFTALWGIQFHGACVVSTWFEKGVCLVSKLWCNFGTNGLL